MLSRLTAFHPRPDEERRPVKPVVAALALFGALALAGGTWALDSPDAVAGLAQVAIAEPRLRVALILALWAAFVTVAAYMTLHWNTLRWWEAAASWALATWLWVGGLLLVYAPQAQFRAWLPPLLVNPFALRLASLLSLVGGATLLALAFALWPARHRPRRRHRPRIVHTVHHPRPA